MSSSAHFHSIVEINTAISAANARRTSMNSPRFSSLTPSERHNSSLTSLTFNECPFSCTDSTSSNAYSKPITYWNYIHPTTLIDLQSGREGQGLNHHEEHLFVITHQVFELWFKQILHDLTKARDLMTSETFTPTALLAECDQCSIAKLLQRAAATMRLAANSYDLLDRMNPADFLQFRDILGGSSGFQSFQLREIEILLGIKDEERVLCEGQSYKTAFLNPEAVELGLQERLEKRRRELSLKDALFYTLKTQFPIEIQSHLDQFHSAYLVQHSTELMQRVEFRRSEITSIRQSFPHQTTAIESMEHSLKQHELQAQQSINETKQFLSDPEFGTPRLQMLWLLMYPNTVLSCRLSQILDSLTDFERSVIQWRQRHARTVEYFIGRRRGTGHTTGVDYIEQTGQQYRVFSDIWKLKTMQIPAFNWNHSTASPEMN
jgi:tryptophan 2,3-dioxygenase